MKKNTAAAIVFEKIERRWGLDMKVRYHREPKLQEDHVDIHFREETEKIGIIRNFFSSFEGLMGKKDDVLHSSGNFTDDGKDAFYALYYLNREVLDYCTAYEKAEPLIADGLSEKYHCLAEFGGTALSL